MMGFKESETLCHGAKDMPRIYANTHLHRVSGPCQQVGGAFAKGPVECLCLNKAARRHGVLAGQLFSRGHFREVYITGHIMIQTNQTNYHKYLKDPI